PASDSGFLRDP
uniref:Extended FMRFamide-10 n=1 Tax=Tyrannophasma gladiator TaxID=270861 RepID=FAR10_TYRGL|nr:RecName: Full=Extended FMRFamide-10; Short=FMRFa-10 [Tyrannophasma gladiator]